MPELNEEVVAQSFAGHSTLDPTVVAQSFRHSDEGFPPAERVKVESIDTTVYGKYRKALVAAFGVLLIALGLYSDNAWSFDDTRTLVEAIGAALGVYEVPNDQRVS